MKYVPGLKYNLFSITRLLRKGYKITNDKEIIKLTSNQSNIVFDEIKETMMGGYIMGIKMRKIYEEKRNTKDFGQLCYTNIAMYDLTHLHKVLGHVCEKHVRLPQNTWGGISKEKTLN